MNGAARIRGAGSDILALVGFVALCLGVAAIGGWATTSSVESWYRTLAKPSFTPPDSAFAPVWTALYLMMAVAAWRVWRTGRAERATALALFGVQLALNLLWSILFFGLRAIGPALIDIVLLVLAIVATALAFLRIDRAAAILLIPYLAWVTFAVALNAEIWLLN